MRFVLFVFAFLRILIPLWMHLHWFDCHNHVFFLLWTVLVLRIVSTRVTRTRILTSSRFENLRTHPLLPFLPGAARGLISYLGSHRVHLHPLDGLSKDQLEHWSHSNRQPRVERGVSGGVAFGRVHPQQRSMFLSWGHVFLNIRIYLVIQVSDSNHNTRTFSHFSKFVYLVIQVSDSNDNTRTMVFSTRPF